MMKKILCLLTVLFLCAVLPAAAEEALQPVTAGELSSLLDDIRAQALAASPLNDPADEVNSRFRNDLLKLLTFFPAEKVHVLEYWLDVSLFSNWRRPLRKIGCPPEVMRRDLEFYCSLGIRNFATFAVMMDETYFAEFGDGELTACGQALNEFLGK